jgi:hypothetical protein
MPPHVLHSDNARAEDPEKVISSFLPKLTDKVAGHGRAALPPDKQVGLWELPQGPRTTSMAVRRYGRGQVRRLLLLDAFDILKDISPEEARSFIGDNISTELMAMSVISPLNNVS